MAAPVLFGPAFSTYVRTVRIALAEKGVDYVLEEFNFLEAWPEGYEQRHPFRKVPAFEHGGLSLYEAFAIGRYVDEAFPGPALQPAAPALRARMTQIVGICDCYVYGPVIGAIVWQRLVTPMLGGTTDEAVIAGAVPRAELAMRVLDGFLASGPYLAGEDFSLADAHLAPLMGYFSQVPEGRKQLDEKPHLADWWRRTSARRSVESTTPAL